MKTEKETKKIFAEAKLLLKAAQGDIRKQVTNNGSPSKSYNPRRNYDTDRKPVEK